MNSSRLGWRILAAISISRENKCWLYSEIIILWRNFAATRRPRNLATFTTPQPPVPSTSSVSSTSSLLTTQWGCSSLSSAIIMTDSWRWEHHNSDSCTCHYMTSLTCCCDWVLAVCSCSFSLITCCNSSVLNCRSRSIHSFSLVSCWFSLVACSFSPVSCSFSLVTRSFSLVSCWFYCSDYHQ